MTPEQQLELIKLLNLAVVAAPKIAKNVREIKDLLAQEVDMSEFAQAILDENAETQKIVDDLKSGV